MSIDRGYTNLLAHLHRPSSSRPIDINIIASSLAHYLATLHPSPMPLAAACISSPLFGTPLSHAKLAALGTALRHAIHLKAKASRTAAAGLFTQGVDAEVRAWVGQVLRGCEGGSPMLRLACTGGLLLGLVDLERRGTLQADKGGRGRVEDEVVVALAEVMEVYEPGSEGAWRSEFLPAVEGDPEDGLALALMLAAQSLPLVSLPKLKALPLPTIAQHITSAIITAFHASSGSFLDPLSVSVTHKDVYAVYIPPTSPIALSLPTLTASPLYAALAPLSKLAAHVHVVLLDAHPARGLTAAVHTLRALETLAGAVERGWVQGGLAGVREDQIEPDSRKVTSGIWTMLKTLLFSTVMVAEAILGATVFVPPSAYSPTPTSTPTTPALTPTPQSLAHHTLRTLAHLAFVLTQFGGVTTTATAEFPQLKRTFYIALDVLADGGGALAAELVRGLCEEDAMSGHDAHIHAKKAFVLACIEQVIPVLGEDIMPLVFNACFPHLNDANHRETYESAHSVVLAMFAAHAHANQDNKIESKSGGKSWDFMNRAVPFYATCLIENSVAGRLSTSQLQLAYSSIVRSASASGARDRDEVEARTVSRYCIDLLSAAIAAACSPSSPSPSSSASPSPEHEDAGAHAHRLRLTLISTLPALPLGTLEHALQVVLDAILSPSVSPERRGELVEALFSEVLERVGDGEKEVVMRWWHDVAVGALGTIGIERRGSDAGVEGEKGGGAGVARL